MIGQFTAAYERRGRWYVAYVEEIPGVNTQGRTLAEAKRNLKEALELVLEAKQLRQAVRTSRGTISHASLLRRLGLRRRR